MIHLDDDERTNLTDMWRAVGSPDHKDPPQWRRKEGSGFIGRVVIAENMPEGHVIRGIAGRKGGTYAHWQIALAYAEYLDPELHRRLHEGFREWITGGALPAPTPDLVPGPSPVPPAAGQGAATSALDLLAQQAAILQRAIVAVAEQGRRVDAIEAMVETLAVAAGI